MGGIAFPNFNALGGLMQMDRQAESDRLSRERLDRHDQWMQQDRTEARDLQKMQVQQALSDKQRTLLKDAADATSQAALGVLGAPEAERPAAYQSALSFLKSRGLPTDNLPPQYSAGMDGMLRFYVQRAESAHDYLKRQGEMPQPMGPVGGAAPGAAPGGPAPNRDQFVSMMMPHALEVSRQTGIDPRLVVAQSALETGYGQSAPGNNYFGIKSHGQPGGQTLATQEAGPNGMYGTRESFRTYGDAGASAKDYADFIKTNGRYAPVMAAQGLDAQIDAMGKSGYATDPNYAAKLRQIAQGIGGPQSGPQYTMGTAPPSIANSGANAAPMPGPPAGLTPPGPPPAEMPNGPRFAQAGGAPVIPQGDAVAGQGDVMAPPRAAFPTTGGGTIEHDVLKQIQLPQGAQIVKRKGAISQPQPDSVEIMYPDGRLGIVRLPPKEAAPSGYRPSASGGLEPIPGGPGEAAATKQNAEQANKLRDDFRMEPVVKAYRVVVPMLESAKDAAGRPTRAADLNLVYAFAKLMDPESVVRESETGMVVASGTVADRLAGIVGQLNGNATLQPETRKKLIAELDSRFNALEASYKEIEGAYGEIADSNGVKRSHVILPIRKPKADTPQGDATPATGAQGPKMSPADAAKLPPGTPFIGEDGVPRVRN